MKDQLILQIILMINHYLRSGSYDASFFKDYAIKAIHVDYDKQTDFTSMKDWCLRIKEDGGHCAYIEYDLNNEFIIVCEFDNYIKMWQFSFSYDGLMWTLNFDHITSELQNNRMIYPLSEQVSEFRKAVKMMVKTSESLYMGNWVNVFSSGLSTLSSKDKVLDEYEHSFDENERRVILALEKLWIFGKTGGWYDLPKTRASQLGYYDFNVKSQKFKEEYVRTMKSIMKK